MDCSEIKDQIKKLKAERKELARIKKTRKAIEDQAKLDFQDEVLDQLSSKEEEISRIKKQLTDSLQRERNTRTRFEKDKKTLLKQVEQLTSVLEHNELKYKQILRDKELEMETKMNERLEMNKEAARRTQAQCETLVLKTVDEVFVRSEESFKRILELLEKATEAFESRRAPCNASCQVIEKSFTSASKLANEKHTILQRVQNEVAEQEAQLKKEKTETRHWFAKSQHLENRVMHISKVHEIQVEELTQRHNHKIKQTNDSFNAELDDIRARVGLILEEKDSKIQALRTKLKELESLIVAKDTDIESIKLALTQ